MQAWFRVHAHEVRGCTTGFKFAVGIDGQGFIGGDQWLALMHLFGIGWARTMALRGEGQRWMFRAVSSCEKGLQVHSMDSPHVNDVLFDWFLIAVRKDCKFIPCQCDLHCIEICIGICIEVCMEFCMCIELRRNLCK